MENSDLDWQIVDDTVEPRRYLATVVVEVAFFLRLEANTRAEACEEAIASVKAAEFRLNSAEAHSLDIRGCDAIAL